MIDSHILQPSNYKCSKIYYRTIKKNLVLFFAIQINFILSCFNCIVTDMNKGYTDHI